METILVHATFDEPTYSSVSEAIVAASDKNTRTEMAKLDSVRLSGLLITGGNWTDTQLLLHLSGGSKLSVFLGQEVVEWTIIHPNEDVVLGSDGASDVTLIFQDAGQHHVWHRQQLIESRIGHPIQRLAAGVSWLYIYIADCPILLCTRLRADRADGDLLYWDDTD